ncbi:MAG: hypothetical protein U9N61_02210 [Euryarchaeota archaeon]|nr:hypothetical protein [Euryarchaeota archaeon]
MGDWYNITYKVPSGITEIECSVSGTLSDSTADLDAKARIEKIVSDVIGETGMLVVTSSKEEVEVSDAVRTGYW